MDTVDLNQVQEEVDTTLEFVDGTLQEIQKKLNGMSDEEKRTIMVPVGTFFDWMTLMQQLFEHVSTLTKVMLEEKK